MVLRLRNGENVPNKPKGGGAADAWLQAFDESVIGCEGGVIAQHGWSVGSSSQ